MNFILALILLIVIIFAYRQNTVRSLFLFIVLLLLLPLASRLSFLTSWQIGQSDYVLSLYSWLGLAFFLLYFKRLLSHLKRFNNFLYSIFILYSIILFLQFVNPLNYTIQERVWGLRDIAAWIGFVSAYIVWIEKRPIYQIDQDNIFKGIFILAIIATLYSMYQVFFGFTSMDETFLKYHGFAIDNEAQPFNWSIMLDGRPRFLQTSFLSNKYLIQVYLLLYLVVFRKTMKYKILGYIFGVILILGLTINLERSPIMLIIISIVLTNILTYLISENKMKKVLVSVASIVVVVSIFLSLVSGPWLNELAESNIITKRFVNITNYESDPAFYGRIVWWIEIYIPRIISNPLGYGLGSTSDRDPEIIADLRPPPHNFYIYYAYEIGLIGLFIFLLIIFYMIYHSLKMKKGKPIGEQLIITYFVSVVIVNLAEGVANIPFYENDIVLSSYIIAMYLAYQFKLINRGNEDASILHKTPVLI
ncbi:MAG: O-antigen ligase family protein [Ignavibacteriales bacterium]|nr:O-antigen ligase family protein [Ignavibacteriales bacterium]